MRSYTVLNQTRYVISCSWTASHYLIINVNGFIFISDNFNIIQQILQYNKQIAQWIINTDNSILIIITVNNNQRIQRSIDYGNDT